jgi:hypothetical protein
MNEKQLCSDTIEPIFCKVSLSTLQDIEHKIGTNMTFIKTVLELSFKGKDTRSVQALRDLTEAWLALVHLLDANRNRVQR